MLPGEEDCILKEPSQPAQHAGHPPGYKFHSSHPSHPANSQDAASHNPTTHPSSTTHPTSTITQPTSTSTHFTIDSNPPKKRTNNVPMSLKRPDAPDALLGDFGKITKHSKTLGMTSITPTTLLTQTPPRLSHNYTLPRPSTLTIQSTSTYPYTPQHSPIVSPSLSPYNTHVTRGANANPSFPPTPPMPMSKTFILTHIPPEKRLEFVQILEEAFKDLSMQFMS